MAAGMATEYEAMVPDPRPSWAAPLSWEVTARALGGRRKALIRSGALTNAISNPTSAIPSNKQGRGLGRLFLYRASPRSQPFRELCTKKNWGKLDMESI
jgi:hypothetical protein